MVILWVKNLKENLNLNGLPQQNKMWTYLKCNNFNFKMLFSNIKIATTNGKQIVNMLYHDGVETILTVGYSELGKKY